MINNTLPHTALAHSDRVFISMFKCMIKVDHDLLANLRYTHAGKALGN